MSRFFDYIYIIATIFFTVYGQIILKYRISHFGQFPKNALDKLVFLLFLIIDPLIFSGFVAAFLASLAWMAAMTKFDLSHAYPFMSLNFVAVLLLSVWFLSEPMTIQKVLGVVLIVLGTVIIARG